MVGNYIRRTLMYVLPEQWNTTQYPESRSQFAAKLMQLAWLGSSANTTNYVRWLITLQTGCREAQKLTKLINLAGTAHPSLHNSDITAVLWTQWEDCLSMATQDFRMKPAQATTLSEWLTVTTCRLVPVVGDVSLRVRTLWRFDVCCTKYYTSIFPE